LPKGRRLAIVTNAGGPGIMATDAAERRGLWLTNFTDGTIGKLQAELPPEAGVYNPVDVLGDALADRYSRSVASVLDDPNVDAAVVVLTPQAMTEITETATELIKLASAGGKPVFACFMGGHEADKGVKVLREGGIPNFSFPERAVAMVATMADYKEARERPKTEPPRLLVDSSKVKRIFSEAGERRYLVDGEALAVAEAYGISVPKTSLAQSVKEALSAAAELRYPVVLKVSSPDVLHKSDIGALKVNVANDFELRRAYREVLANVESRLPDAEIRGVMVQEMITGGREVILGMNRDPQFGPLLMFGLGGIYVEVLKDLAFRLTPLGRPDAVQMVEEIRSYPLLHGVRGQPRADIEAIVDDLLRLSQLVTDWSNIEELDINPLMVLEAGRGAIAADVRILTK
jgi:acetate---CoA ligase (ADP-forming)